MNADSTYKGRLIKLLRELINLRVSNFCILLTIASLKLPNGATNELRLDTTGFFEIGFSNKRKNYGSHTIIRHLKSARNYILNPSDEQLIKLIEKYGLSEEQLESLAVFLKYGYID